MKLKVKLLTTDGKTPKRASASSAGLDLFSPKDVLIKAGESFLLPLNIAVEIPEGYVGLIYARSGLSVKKGIVMKNSVGVIDSDYRGEVCVPLMNISDEDYQITRYERVAQIVITPYLHCDTEEVDSLEDTKRGAGGFGSTGKTV